MAKSRIEIRTNPPDLFQRLEGYEQRVDTEINKTMEAALRHVEGSAPEYPVQGAGITYNRTYTLGRSIGLQGGRAEIREVRRIGRGKYEGRVGTRLYYAPYVIGDPQARNIQASSSNWWTITDWAKKAEKGIANLFEKMCDRMASWIDG